METIYIIVVFALVVVLFYALYKSNGGNKHKEEIISKMQKIHAKTLASGGSVNYRDGIVRLDSQLAKALQHKFQNSESIGLNLQRLNSRTVSRNLLDKVWKSHKIRNQIVHDDIEVTKEDFKETYQSYIKLINIIL